MKNMKIKDNQKEIYYGALERIVKEVKEKRKATCLMKDCIVNQIIGGNDIDLVEEWMNKIKNNKS